LGEVGGQYAAKQLDKLCHIPRLGMLAKGSGRAEYLKVNLLF